MIITQEGNRIRIQIAQKKPVGWNVLADFKIDKADYAEFRDHVKEKLDAFEPKD